MVGAAQSLMIDQKCPDVPGMAWFKRITSDDSPEEEAVEDVTL